MILKLEDLKKKIEYLELNKMKDYISKNMNKIFDDILSNKNLKSIDLEKELKFDKIKNQKLFEYNIENKKSILYIQNLDDEIYFILRNQEINNYYEKNLLKNHIKDLEKNQIIEKINKFDFMIIEYKEKKFILLFHKDNDFKIK